MGMQHEGQKLLEGFLKAIGAAEQIGGSVAGGVGVGIGAKGRKALSSEEVLTNALTYQEQIFHILDKSQTEVRYNGEWLELLRLEDMLKERWG
jgi:hypothetical protein